MYDTIYSGDSPHVTVNGSGDSTSTGIYSTLYVNGSSNTTGTGHD